MKYNKGSRIQRGLNFSNRLRDMKKKFISQTPPL